MVDWASVIAVVIVVSGFLFIMYKGLKAPINDFLHLLGYLWSKVTGSLSSAKSKTEDVVSYD